MNQLVFWWGIIAMAPPAEGEQGGAGFLGSPFILLLLIAAMFYFVLYLPEKKRRQERERMLKSLEKGDEVVTNGGLYGKIIAVSASENTVTLEIAPNVKVKVGLPFVSRVPSKDKAGKAENEKKKD